MFIKPERKVTKVFLHCSANDNEAFYGAKLKDFIYDIHVNQNGWDDIGYSFMIDRLGRRLNGRSLETIPASQRGHNTNSIAVCVHGLETFTGESMEALVLLCKEINEAYGGDIEFHGHCEVSNKTCPVYDYQTVLQLDGEGYMLEDYDFGYTKEEEDVC